MQSTLDIDWFGVDDDGNIAHFASGGGGLPDTVAAFKEDTEEVGVFFRNNLPTISETQMSNFILEKLSLKTQAEANRYLHDFITMSSKGLFSYDKSGLGDFLNRDYQLIMMPERKINIDDLPISIGTIIRRTKFKGNFAALPIITLGV